MARSFKHVAAHAAVRFGLGARPNELVDISGDPAGWVMAQIQAPMDTLDLFRHLPTRHQAAQLFGEYRAQKKAFKEQQQEEKTATGMKNFPGRAAIRNLIADEIQARLMAGLNTRWPLQERMLRFWSNHFTISAKRQVCAPFVGAIEREAIRPHLFGKFETMLRAVAEHPGMLLYLDNASSVGPNSRQGARRGKGLNENLAREIMELHTLGVGGGYRQEDVTNFARILTGWTVMPMRLAPDRAGEFYFNARGHEPGNHRVLGKSYADDGKAQGDAALHDLTRHPATAQHIAIKLARHFIADDPPPKAVARIAEVFTESGGDLAEVTAAVIRAPEAWDDPLTKFRNSEDYLLAVWRSLDVRRPERKWVMSAYNVLGQKPYTADSPAGWGDQTQDWSGPDAVMKRISWAHAVADRAADGNNADIPVFAETILGGLLSARTAEALTRAASRRQALALLFAGPEMQRR